jgi:hypothetical protein
MIYLVLEKITFEVELAFSRFKERSKLIRNVQDIYNMHYLIERFDKILEQGQMKTMIVIVSK